MLYAIAMGQIMKITKHQICRQNNHGQNQHHSQEQDLNSQHREQDKDQDHQLKPKINCIFTLKSNGNVSYVTIPSQRRKLDLSKKFTKQK